jgi:hypothetical protein
MPAILPRPRARRHSRRLPISSTCTSENNYGALIAEETEKYGKVVRAANIKVEWAIRSWSIFDDAALHHLF